MNEVTTAAVAPQQRLFLHQLAKVHVGGNEYEIAGARWTGRKYGDIDGLNLYASGAGFEQREVFLDYQGDTFRWTFTRLIAEGIYARHNRQAESVEAACAEALAYTPTPLTFNYLTSDTVWYETSPGHLIASIDGDEAKVWPMHSGEGYGWSRYWASAQPVLELFSGSEGIRGAAPSKEAAMAACMAAPDTLKHACATLIANLRGAEQ